MPQPAFRAFRDNSTTLDLAPVYTYNAEGADLTDRAEPERVALLMVGADYFRVLGVRLLAGQPFGRDAERANANVVVIRERIWREYLSARRDAIGQTISVNGVRQQVVGVVPDAFEDPLVPGVEIWTPLDFASPNRTQWYNHYLSVIGRLRPGATLDQAQAELKTIASQIESNYGVSSTRRWARVTPLQVDTVGSAGRVLWMLFGAGCHSPEVSSAWRALR
jgi:putative ABC transport system permease protein